MYYFSSKQPSQTVDCNLFMLPYYHNLLNKDAVSFPGLLILD
jgi:hypothetical protein